MQRQRDDSFYRELSGLWCREMPILQRVEANKIAGRKHKLHCQDERTIPLPQTELRRQHSINPSRLLAIIFWCGIPFQLSKFSLSCDNINISAGGLQQRMCFSMYSPIATTAVLYYWLKKHGMHHPVLPASSFSDWGVESPSHCAIEMAKEQAAEASKALAGTDSSKISRVDKFYEQQNNSKLSARTKFEETAAAEICTGWLEECSICLWFVAGGRGRGRILGVFAWRLSPTPSPSRRAKTQHLYVVPSTNLSALFVEDSVYRAKIESVSIK